MESQDKPTEVQLDIKKHMKFLNYMLNVLPTPYSGQVIFSHTEIKFPKGL